jgi:hypothetical protein
MADYDRSLDVVLILSQQRQEIDDVGDVPSVLCDVISVVAEFMVSHDVGDAPSVFGRNLQCQR